MFDLTFTNVSKKYRIRENGAPRYRSTEFWALRNVSFEVPAGAALGIIGPNGAGKSTILKLLSSITAPTSGEISIRGRLSAVIEVGSGFHPELTGRENVFLSGSILGMRRREIADKLESIVEFAGVGPFIDNPVKRYSSGMYVRLGFSIAAHLDADVLLLDEVLAVGDAEFQSRCLSRITELKSAGKTIVFVSHDLTAVEVLCDRVMLLERGRIAEIGKARDIIITYQRRGSITQLPVEEHADLLRPVRITQVICSNAEGLQPPAFRRGDPIAVRIAYDSRVSINDVVFETFFYFADNRFRGKFSTATTGDEINIEPGTGIVEFFYLELDLPAGLYFLDATISRRKGGEEIEWRYRCTTLLVEATQSMSQSGLLPCEWKASQHQTPGSATQVGLSPESRVVAAFK